MQRRPRIPSGRVTNRDARSPIPTNYTLHGIRPGSVFSNPITGRRFCRVYHLSTLARPLENKEVYFGLSGNHVSCKACGSR